MKSLRDETEDTLREIHAILEIPGSDKGRKKYRALVAAANAIARLRAHLFAHNCELVKSEDNR